MTRSSGAGWHTLVLLLLSASAAHALDYRVRSGDTLSEIAGRFGTSVRAIQEANGLSTTRIRAGDLLRIPVDEPASIPASAPSAPAPSAPASSSAPAGEGERYTVRRGDTLSGIASRMGVELHALMRANSLSGRSTIHPGQTLTLPGAPAGGVSRPSAATSAPPPGAVPTSPVGMTHPPMRVPEAHVEVLARIVKGECWYDTPFEGMVAVAATVLNRVRAGYFGRTIPAVALSPSQFSCYNPEFRDRLYHGSIPEVAWQAARAALDGADPTGGATHYYNPYLVRPRWARTLDLTVKIGTNRRNTHSFYK